MDDHIKIKGEKGTKGRKDKNKKSVYSSKHVRNQIQSNPNNVNVNNREIKNTDRDSS